MSRRTRRLLLIIPLFACGLVTCAAVALFAMSGLVTELGPASSTLSPLQSIPITAHLVLRAPAIESAAGNPDATLDLVVAEGASAQSVIDQLVAAEIVSDGLLFRNYLQYTGLDTGIQAGSYRVSGAMTIRELAEVLQIARPAEVVLTILEGWRLEQVAQAVELANLSYGADEFLSALDLGGLQHSLIAELTGAPSLEGFLFPDTYRLEPEDSPQGLIEAALDNFDQRVSAELRAEYHAHGLTLLQAVTLASIVEREAVVAAERPLIAAVFLRRLRSGLPLEADPTVQYALGLQDNASWWKSPLTFVDLEVDSPYNTYRSPGLPPGPIANPGLSSLEAVGSPPETSYLYFRASCDGSGTHQFSETFDEHLSNACP
jgi:UPF0755 protein